jgi:hypothetical protein
VRQCVRRLQYLGDSQTRPITQISDGLRCRSIMHNHEVHTHNGIPDDETHDGIGTSAGIRLFDCINIWRALWRCYGFPRRRLSGSWVNSGNP